MPVYTYHCKNCGIQFEATQKFVDNPLVTCPECGKKTLQKVYTPVGIVFKGSGFYATDHRSPSGMTYGSHNDEKSSEEKKEPEKKSETKTTSTTSETVKPAPSAEKTPEK
jgi:putative FmdB family regulatory protein